MATGHLLVPMALEVHAAALVKTLPVGRLVASWSH